VSDFEYEFQLAGIHARLNPRIETGFLLASARAQLIYPLLIGLPESLHH
jgi:pantetheine-phosphate adenylyltransferase